MTAGDGPTSPDQPRPYEGPGAQPGPYSPYGQEPGAYGGPPPGQGPYGPPPTAPYQGGYGQGGYGQGGYGQGGYNQGGYNQGGYNQGGYNQGGYNQGGYGQGGFGPGYGPPGPPPQGPRRSVWLPVVLGLVALLVVGAIVGGVALIGSGRSEPTPTAAPPPPPSTSAAPTTSTAPPSTSVAPTTTYTASTMFGTGNGSCQPLDNLNATEVEGILCTRGGDVDAFFIQYRGSAQSYATSLRSTLQTMEPLGEDDCRLTYKGTNTPNDGEPRHQYIIIYKNSNFAGTWIGERDETTFQQLIDEPARAADEAVLCGR